MPSFHTLVQDHTGSDDGTDNEGFDISYDNKLEMAGLFNQYELSGGPSPRHSGRSPPVKFDLSGPGMKQDYLESHFQEDRESNTLKNDLYEDNLRSGRDRSNPTSTTQKDGDK